MGKRTLIGIGIVVLLCVFFGLGIFAEPYIMHDTEVNKVEVNIDDVKSIDNVIENAVVLEKQSETPATPATPVMILGLSKIELRTKDKESVGVQVDRVIRDYLWYNSAFDASVPADRIPYSSSQLVCYMEGARVIEMMEWANMSVIPLTPSIALKKDDGYYYGADGQGNFIFQICPSKTEYPTCEFINESNNEYIVMRDTHGFNAVAEQAYLNKDKVDLVIACMDMPDKAKAALYLAQNGIQCYAPCDRFTNDLMNYKEKFGIGTEILGSAPIRKTNYGAVIGDQPVVISLNEPIIAQYTDRMYPDQYCDTPSRYFRELQRVYKINLSVTEVYANIGETCNLVKEAKEQNAEVIGARIFNETDYLPLKNWLEENKNHRVILFHSAAYEFGIELFRAYPGQTSFGDINPKFVGDNFEPKKNISALVSFTFDDSNPNHLEKIAPFLEQYDMKATRYYVTGVSWTNFTECKILQDQYNWEIGGHTRTHPDLTNITLEQVKQEICGGKSDFIANGIAVKSFAPPYTEINADTMNIVKECYESCRNDWGINYPPYEPYRIRMLSSLDNIDRLKISEISDKLDEAIENNGWIVFYSHRVDNTGNPYCTDEQFFKELLNLISKKPEIEVVTVSEGLEWRW
ncbi:polysaccharide deacetylase family protein [Candidatus Parcubacteria bacterium]|nr:polysaccharide deacetylase family protein [Candidatus Parcubacteria bacterium]